MSPPLALVLVQGNHGLYDVRLFEGGRATCSCPAWRYSRGHEPSCKHTAAAFEFYDRNLKEKIVTQTQQPQTPARATAPAPNPSLALLEALLAEQRRTNELLQAKAEADARAFEALLTTLAVIAKAAVTTPAPAAHPRATSTGTVVPQGEIASDEDLDGKYGNPEIRRDPPRWQGEPMVGRKFSECPPEYLDTLAGFNDWRADQDEKKGDPRSKWARLDAGRARGWARRIRQQQGGGGETPRGGQEPEQDVDDDVPF